MIGDILGFIGRAIGLSERVKRLFGDHGPPPSVDETKRVGLSHQDVEHQQAQIRTATGCCPFRRSGGFHGEDCYDLGREDCTALKRRRTTAKPKPDEDP